MTESTDTDESPQRPMRSLRHGIEYVSVRAHASVLRALPRGAALGLGRAIGRVGWWTRIRRGLVLRILEQALPDRDAAQRARIGAQAAAEFGATVAEFLRFAGRDRERVSELVAIDGLDSLRAELAEGRGALIVTAHLGAWALYVTALAAAGVPSTLLVGVQSNRRVDELILGIPGDAVRFVGKSKSSPRELLESLQAGRVVVMVADHYSSDQQVLVPFLGREAYTLPLPGALVAKYELPLYRMAGTRGAGGRHRLHVDRIALSSDGGEQDRDARRLVGALRVNESLGEAILERPEQYFWYHDRWKQREYRSGPRLRAEV